jgi:hypothetical protein
VRCPRVVGAAVERVGRAPCSGGSVFHRS